MRMPEVLHNQLDYNSGVMIELFFPVMGVEIEYLGVKTTVNNHKIRIRMAKGQKVYSNVMPDVKILGEFIPNQRKKK